MKGICMSRIKTWEEIKCKFIELKENKYSYNEVVYIDMDTPIKIYCNTCNKFFYQKPKYHYKSGCDVCGRNKVKNSRIISIDVLKEKINNKYGDKYTYDWTTYKNSTSKMKIICPDHGEFWQTPSSHCANHGCYWCGIDKISNMKTLSIDVLKDRVLSIHGNLYEYKWETYKNHTTNMTIICKEHGEFKQTPHNHCSGSGCPKCVGKFLTSSELEIEFRKIHGEKYQYDWNTFTNHITKMRMICKKHGDFFLQPYLHKIGTKCPICKASNGETRIRVVLENKNIEFIQEKMFEDCRYVKKLRFDFYLPKHNMCIEYDGIYHFKVTDKTTQEDLDFQKLKDKIKDNYCFVNKIKMIRIHFSDYENIENIINREIDV